MQEIRHDGSEDPEVKEVRVFKEPASDNKEAEEVRPQSKQVPKTFTLQTGMRVSIGNHLYKITTVRQNGKISMKLVKKAKL